MRPESAQDDWTQQRALGWAFCAEATTVARARDRAVRYLIVGIAIAMLIGAAASSCADTVGPSPAISLPFGDIVIPVPMPPTNADPANPASPRDVVTQRYNNLRTGTTLYGGLDQRAVLDGRFGFLNALPVDGVVLAQPLFMESVEFIPWGRRSAVFIATSTNWVYAFDADPPFNKLWEHHLGEPFRIDTRPFNCTNQMAVTEQDDHPMPPNPVLASDGIQSTPVIDFARSRIIVSYRGMDGIPDGTQRIAALDLRTGQLVKGADGRDLDRRVTGNPLWNLVHRNRASLLLDGGYVYVAFAGRCEQPDWPHKDLSFQGWIYAFDATTLADAGWYRSTQQPHGSAPDPTGDSVAGGGIWQASTGLAADGRGSLYFATGNQSQGYKATSYPVDALGKNLADSIVRLRIDTRADSISMTPIDWFTPYRKTWLDRTDLDLGSAAVVLIPKSRYLVAGGKEGVLYVLDRDHLGKFDDSAAFSDPSVPGAPFATSQDELMRDDPRRDQVVQKFRASENQYCAAGPNPVFCLGGGAYPAGSPHDGVDMHVWPPWPHIHGTPVFGAFPDGSAFLYLWAEKDFLKSFRWWGKRFETTPTIATKPGTGEKVLAPPYLGNVLGADGKLLSNFGMPGGFLALTIDPAQPAAGVAIRVGAALATERERRSVE